MSLIQGAPVTSAMDILSRPYPKSVPGTRLKYSFSSKSKMFKLEFEKNTDIAQSGSVYIPSNIYGESRYFKG